MADNPILTKIIQLLPLKKPSNYSLIFSALWGAFYHIVVIAVSGTVMQHVLSLSAVSVMVLQHALLLISAVSVRVLQHALTLISADAAHH